MQADDGMDVDTAIDPRVDEPPQREGGAAASASADERLQIDSWSAVMARVAHRCNPTAPPVGDGDANADLLDMASLGAASAVLVDMRCPASARGDLASWLRRHVVAATQRRAEAPLSWQWNLTCVAWAVHAAGADNPAEQQQAFRSLGITEATARQLPFRAWREGRSGLAPGVTIPGMRARAPMDTAGG